MKHIFPDHYNEFHCIADRCTITCCQEWKITVDDDTNRKWKKILPPDTISDKRKNLTAYTCKKDAARLLLTCGAKKILNFQQSIRSGSFISNVFNP